MEKLVFTLHAEPEEQTPEEVEEKDGLVNFAQKIREVQQLESTGLWGWCTAVVTAQLMSDDPVPLELDREETTLGQCCYHSAADFVQSSGYFDQMCQEAIQEIQKRAEERATKR